MVVSLAGRVRVTGVREGGSTTPVRKADVARHAVVVQTLQVHKVLEHLLIAPVCVRSNTQPLQNAATLSVMIASTQCPLSPADTPAHSTTPTFAAFPATLAAACHLAVLQFEIEDDFSDFSHRFPPRAYERKPSANRCLSAAEL